LLGDTLRDQERDLHGFRLRLAFAFILTLAACGLLVSRFVFLQVLAYESYHTQAEANRITIVPVVPNRGLILDRNGVVLARNFSAYTLEITPSKLSSWKILSISSPPSSRSRRATASASRSC